MYLQPIHWIKSTILNWSLNWKQNHIMYMTWSRIHIGFHIQSSCSCVLPKTGLLIQIISVFFPSHGANFTHEIGNLKGTKFGINCVKYYLTIRNWIFGRKFNRFAMDDVVECVTRQTLGNLLWTFGIRFFSVQHVCTCVCLQSTVARPLFRYHEGPVQKSHHYISNTLNSLQLNRITWVKRFDIYLLILFEIPQLHRTDSNLGSGYIAIAVL